MFRAVLLSIITTELSSVLILLASCNCKLYDIYHCCAHSKKLLMMGKGTVRNI